MFKMLSLRLGSSVNIHRSWAIARQASSYGSPQNDRTGRDVVVRETAVPAGGATCTAGWFPAGPAGTPQTDPDFQVVHTSVHLLGSLYRSVPNLQDHK